MQRREDMRAAFKKAVNRLGLDIRLTRNIAQAEARRKLEAWRRSWLALRNLGPIRTVLDVGANEGQFSTMIRGVFPDAAIYAFEPLADCQDALRRCLAEAPGSRIFPVALGAAPQRVPFRRTSFSPCSSFLRPTDRLRGEVDNLKEEALVEVPIARLDDILALHPPVGPLLLKLDVQGYERQVLEGAPRTLADVAILVLEVAFVPLYEQQPLFDDMFLWLRDRGFRYRGNIEQSASRVDGLVTEADALFVRDGAGENR